MMSSTRRQFIKDSVLIAGGWAVGGGLGMTAGCAGPRTGDSASASFPIIDTHTHFYDPNRPQGVPWPPKNDALLYRKVMPANYLAQPVPQPVTGTVVVEASPWLEDNQWILDLAKDNPFIVGFVGNLKPGEAGFKNHLERFAANPIFRGIRIQAGSLAEGLANETFLQDLTLLADLDLELDVNGPPSTLPDVARLAARLPSLRIVIDHLSNTTINGVTVDPAWAIGMQAAAAQGNVFAKVSGLVEGARSTIVGQPSPADVSFYQPHLDVMWDAFGEDRLIYGSNWPVSKRFASLAQVQSIVADYFVAKGAAALRKVFSENASRAYRWVRRS